MVMLQVILINDQKVLVPSFIIHMLALFQGSPGTFVWRAWYLSYVSMT